MSGGATRRRLHFCTEATQGLGHTQLLSVASFGSGKEAQDLLPWQRWKKNTMGMTGSHGEHGKTWWGINCFKWFNQQNHTENWWARENTERILEPKVRMWSNKMSIRGLWDGYSQSRVLSQTQPTKKRMKKGMKKEWKRYMANKNVGAHRHTSISIVGVGKFSEAAMDNNWSRWSTTRRPASEGGEKSWNSCCSIRSELKYLQISSDNLQRSSKVSIDLIQSHVFLWRISWGDNGITFIPFRYSYRWSLWGCPGIPAGPRRRTSAPLSGAVGYLKTRNWSINHGDFQGISHGIAWEFHRI